MYNKKKILKILNVFIFLIGFSVCCYPFISSMIQSKGQKDIISTYESYIEDFDKMNIQEELKQVEEYNNVLFQSKGYLIDGETASILSQEHYEDLLDISGSGMMGSIEIPKINVYLPIYHGVSDSVLSNSIGHLEGSSLPIGGNNTRTVLTGHRGLPNAKLFTRLDELEENDLIYLHVLNETLAYKVIEIDVIEPEDLSWIQIESDQDLVSLVTCTPYGINTHRLVVTGERVAYEKAEYETLKPEIMSIRELIFIGIPFLFLGVSVIYTFRRRTCR